MKKLLVILLVALMVLSIVACNDTSNQNNNDDEKYKDKTVILDHETPNNGTDTFYYENVDSETVIIVNFSTTNDKMHPVYIPAYFVNNGGEKPLRVVGIGKEAFHCSSSVETLIFPTEEDYLKHDAGFDMSQHSFVIGEYALRECVSLKSLNIPAYVTEIGARAFYGCISLETITFEANSKLEKINGAAFMDCTALKSVDIPGSVKSIEEMAFHHCTALASVIINEGTVTIGAQAFQECAALAEVKLPASLESIGLYAFQLADPDGKGRPLTKDGLTYAGESQVILAYISNLGLK